jgi:hypothetical protein
MCIKKNDIKSKYKLNFPIFLVHQCAIPRVYAPHFGGHCASFFFSTIYAKDNLLKN